MKKNIFTILTIVALFAILATATFASSLTPVNTDWEAKNLSTGKVETFLVNALSDAEMKDENGLVSYRTIDPETPHATVDYVDLFYLHEGHKSVDNIDGYVYSTYAEAHEGYEIVLNLNGDLLVGGIDNSFGVYAKGIAEEGMAIVATSKHSNAWWSNLCVGANDMVLESSLVVLTEDDWATPIVSEEDGEFEYAFVLGEKWVAPVVTTEDNQSASDPEPASEQPEQPEQETEQPEQETEQPEQETEQPEQETEQPEQETEQPEQETEQPEQETEQPEQETEQPEQETEQPEQETEQPEQETEQPEDHVAEYDEHVTADPTQFHDDAFNNPLEAPEKPAYGEYDEHSEINLGAFGGESSDSSESSDLNSVETYGANETDGTILDENNTSENTSNETVETYGANETDGTILDENNTSENTSNETVETYGANETDGTILDENNTSENTSNETVETYGAEGFANLEPSAPAYGEYDNHGSINLGAFGGNN